MSKRKNVLLLCADEMRADHLACMGNRVVQTPNLDRIAARGTLFRRGYCNNPICMPARATMFTGMLPRDHGLRVNGQTAHPGLPWMAEILSDAGYRTHSSGKLHLTPWVLGATAEEADSLPEDLGLWNRGELTQFPTPYYGFQSVDFVSGHTSFVSGEYLAWLTARGGSIDALRPAPDRMGAAGIGYRTGIPEELHYNRFIADGAIRVIEESAAEDAPPFLIWCSFPDPHMPVAAPSPYFEMYDSASIPLPPRGSDTGEKLQSVYDRIRAGELRPNGINNAGVTDAQWREIIATTYAMITHMDAEIGRVLDALERTGQLEETLIVFIADHGDMMGDQGLLWKAFYTFHGCIQIPYIVAVPGSVRGNTSSALVSQIDLLPSVLDWCGVPMPGSDWKEKKTSYPRGALQPLRNYPGESWIPLAHGRIERIHDSIVIENDDPTMGYRVRVLVTDRYRLSVFPGTGCGELYDMQNDPDELHNLWDRDAYRELRASLTAQLLDEYTLATPFYPIPPSNA